MDGEIGTGPWPGFIREEDQLIQDAQKIAKISSGPWTPIVSGRTSLGTATYGNPRTGFYHKIGNFVTLWFTVNWSAHTGTGVPTIRGFPFFPQDTSAQANWGWYGPGVSSVEGMVYLYMAQDQKWATPLGYPIITLVQGYPPNSPVGNVTVGNTVSGSISFISTVN